MHAYATALSSWDEREWIQASCLLEKQSIIYDHIVNPEVQIYSKFLTYRFTSKLCHWTLRWLRLSLLFPWNLLCLCLDFPFLHGKTLLCFKLSCHGHVSLWVLCTQSHRVNPLGCINSVPHSKIYRIHCKGGNWHFILLFHLLKQCNRQ